MKSMAAISWETISTPLISNQLKIVQNMRAIDKICKFQAVAVCTMAICLVVYLLMMLYVQSYPKKEWEPPSSSFIPWLKTPPDRIFNFTLKTDFPLHFVDEKFLSFTVDSSNIRKGLNNPSLWSRQLRRTVKHLGGGYIRFGGTAADLLVFSPGFRWIPDDNIIPDGSACSHELSCPVSLSLQNVKKFTMNADNWKAINSFAAAVNMKLIFDLNVLLRSAAGWNSSNAELLLDFAFAYQYNIDWQLGNEPNSFNHVFGIDLPPNNLSADFNTLRTLLNQYALYNSSKLVGPDVTSPHFLVDDSPPLLERPDHYLDEFLTAGADVDAATWHFYYKGRNATLDDYLDVNTFNSFISSCRRMVDIVRLRAPSKPIWVGETGSSYGGGARGLSDRFVASLLWTDQLGVAAREGISVVMRQSLYSNHYALLGESLEPNPDYWVAILHKRFVGVKVLDIKCTDKDYDHTLRVYAQCSKTMRLIVFGVNIADVFLGLNLRINATANLYLLSSSLKSNLVYLNGKLLTLDPVDYSLPHFHPIPINTNQPISIPPTSIFFIHVDTLIPACLEV